MSANTQGLMTELDAALGKASKAKHSAILRAVTDLFLNEAENYSDDQVAVFDDVIGRLIESTDRQSLVELSTRLAPISKAPANVIGRLSCNDDIAISGLVLGTSGALTDEILAEIAKTKGLHHLAAIAGRTRLGKAVTDVLIDRGNPDLIRKIANSPGACFSELGLVKLVKRAESDKELATAVVSRTDIPHELQPFLKSLLA